MKPRFSSNKCPLSAAFVLAMRGAFGDAEVTWINENGYEYGRDERETHAEQTPQAQPPAR